MKREGKFSITFSQFSSSSKTAIFSILFFTRDRDESFWRSCWKDTFKILLEHLLLLLEESLIQLICQNPSASINLKQQLAFITHYWKTKLQFLLKFSNKLQLIDTGWEMINVRKIERHDRVRMVEVFLIRCWSFFRRTFQDITKAFGD